MALTGQQQQRLINAGFNPNQISALDDILSPGGDIDVAAATTTTAGVVVQSAVVAAPAALTSSNAGSNFADLAAATAAHIQVFADLTAVRTTLAAVLTALKGTTKVMSPT